jgi:hypothetical protein
MVVGAGRRNVSEIGAADASVDAYGCWEGVEKGFEVIALLWVKLWTMA